MDGLAASRWLMPVNPHPVVITRGYERVCHEGSMRGCIEEGIIAYVLWGIIVSRGYYKRMCH